MKFRFPLWTLGILVAFVAVELAICLGGLRENAEIREMTRSCNAQIEAWVARNKAELAETTARHAAEIADRHARLVSLRGELASLRSEAKRRAAR